MLRRDSRSLSVYRLLLIFIGAWLVAACGQQPALSPTAAVGVPTPDAASYPAPNAAYPNPTAPLVYPGPAPVSQGPKFTINKPVKASDIQVTGTGPAGVPIRLIDVTQSGKVIAITTIRDDGSFSFDVAGKLVAGHRVALVLGDTTGTSFNPSDFISGPGYQDFPLIGILFDSAYIE